MWSELEVSRGSERVKSIKQPKLDKTQAGEPEHNSRWPIDKGTRLALRSAAPMLTIVVFKRVPTFRAEPKEEDIEALRAEYIVPRREVKEEEQSGNAGSS